ncbi:uncharacterized protein BYT42DRAFT_163556 [Radiomyces spectabilis]|uniref:uncharacterized protein n=1 Tax=Radiomyces spectabilis TaxID=64574 RepID=UPI00221EBDE6|nr:uncharacterized protein BYT42DRAFT_163556 [Radiomyces spectabilis]KAI8364632.1 hypothetical protein BYT42DRAFT_163556 [Radiomyces spectabilis]
MSTIVDHLHFINPCDDETRMLIWQRGLKEATMELEQKECNLVTTDSQLKSFAKLRHKLLLRSPKVVHTIRSRKLLEITDSLLHFQIHVPSDESPDDVYKRALPTLLTEGLTKDKLESIFIDCDKACFTLTNYSAYPIMMTASQGNSRKALDWLFCN